MDVGKKTGTIYSIQQWEETMKSLLFIMTIFLAISLATPAFAINKNDLNEGKRLYKSFCLVCHGVDGDLSGSLAVKLDLIPPDLTDKHYRNKSIDQLVFLIGGYGGPDNSAMPFSWKTELSESKLRDIAKYLKSLKSSDIDHAGDPRNGKLIYQSSCVACHGSKGKGGGTLANIIGAPKVGFTNGLSIRLLVDAELISAIRDGKGAFMPGWGETLDHDEIVDVAAYVRSLVKHR